MAQGAVSIGNAGKSSIPTVGRVPNGAMIERDSGPILPHENVSSDSAQF